MNCAHFFMNVLYNKIIINFPRFLEIKKIASSFDLKTVIFITLFATFKDLRRVKLYK